MHIWSFCVLPLVVILVGAGLRDETKLAGGASYAVSQIYSLTEIVIGQSPSERQGICSEEGGIEAVNESLPGFDNSGGFSGKFVIAGTRSPDARATYAP